MKVNVNEIKVVKSQLLLKPISKAEKKTTSGIIIPGTDKSSKLEHAEVINVGWDVNAELEAYKQGKLKAGDIVVYNMSYCTPLQFDTEEGDNQDYVTVDFAHVHLIL